MVELATIGIGVIGVVIILAALSIKVIKEYERGVIFRLGRLLGAKGPGLFVIIPVFDRWEKVDLRTVTFDVPPQEVIKQKILYSCYLFYLYGSPLQFVPWH